MNAAVSPPLVSAGGGDHSVAGMHDAPINRPDLVIHVSTENTRGTTVLQYRLHSWLEDLRHFSTSIDGETIQGCFEKDQATLYDELKNLHNGLNRKGAPLPVEEIKDEIIKIGRELYGALFPSPLKEAYCEFRRHVESILIVSDEPWIPWELVKPYNTKSNNSDDDDFNEDDFLCMKFQLGRWISGSRPPAGRILVSRLAAIAAGSPPGMKRLSGARAELRLVNALGARLGVGIMSLADPTYSLVTALLRFGDLGLIHFVGHGEFDLADPNTSGFCLHDGGVLRPRDLQHGGTLQRMKKNRPLVVLNSCQSTRQDFWFTRLGGWAQRFVQDGECGAFIGPQLEIEDREACFFAREFYHLIERGWSLGRAMLATRQKLRDEYPTRLTPLFFTLYGDPNTHVDFNASTVSLSLKDVITLFFENFQRFVGYHLRVWFRRYHFSVAMLIVVFMILAVLGPFFRRSEADKALRDIPRKNASFFEAIEHHRCGIVKNLLLVGVKPRKRKLDNLTPLHWAAWIGDVCSLRLLARNEDLMRSPGSWSPIFYAAISENPKATKVLIEEFKLRPTPLEGARAVYFAASNGRAENLEYLLNLGASSEHIEKERWTSLMVATAEGRRRCVMLLLDAGADVKRKNPDGVTALSIAREKVESLANQKDVNISDLRNREEIVRLLQASIVDQGNATVDVALNQTLEVER